VLDDGLCRAEFPSGIFVPIVSGSDELERLAGFVYIGEGDLQVKVPSRSDAMRFANHMFMRARTEREVLAPMVERLAPYNAHFTRAVVFSADPVVHDMLRSLDPVGAGMVEQEDHTLSSEAGERGINEELVVTNRRGRFKAVVNAGNLMPTRRLALMRSAMDPLEMIQYDRLVHEYSGVPAGQLRMVSEYLTDTPFRVAAGPAGKGPGGKHDRWLSCFRDRVDHLDTGLRSMVFAHGSDSEGAHHFYRFFGQPILRNDPVRLDPVHAQVKVTVDAKRSLSVVKPTVDSLLTLRAHGDGVRHLAMKLPREQAIRGSWKLESLHWEVEGDQGTQQTSVNWLELDAGEELAGLPGQLNLITDGTGGGALASGASGADAAMDNDELSFGADTSGLRSTEAGIAQLVGQAREHPQKVLVLFPRPLKDGEEVKLRVKWKAQWNFANWATYGNTGSTTLVQALGPTTGPRSVLPEMVPSRGGTAWSADIEVGVPPRKVDMAVSGNTRRAWVDESGWNWVASHGEDMRRVAVALGRWKVREDLAYEGMPGVITHLFKKNAYALEQFAAEIRRQHNFMALYLPAPALEEIDVYEGPAKPISLASTGTRSYGQAGMAGLSTIKVPGVGTSVSEFRTLNPYLAQSTLARQMASHVFGQMVVPASGRDTWITEALSETYAAHYLNVALKDEALEAFFKRITALRKSIEDAVEREENMGQTNDKDHFLPLTGGEGRAFDAPKVYQDYGFYTVGWMLRERLGNQAFFDGVRRFTEAHRGELITTERFQKGLEVATGRDLGDFFDWWVRGGYIPKVVVEYTEVPGEGGTAVVGCLLSDVPFGTFDVPIWVRDRGGERSVAALATITDGVGWFDVPAREGEIEVELDPDGLILAYKRRVRKVPETTCGEKPDAAPPAVPVAPIEGSQYKTLDDEFDAWPTPGTDAPPVTPEDAETPEGAEKTDDAETTGETTVPPMLSPLKIPLPTKTADSEKGDLETDDPETGDSQKEEE